MSVYNNSSLDIAEALAEAPLVVKGGGKPEFYRKPGWNLLREDVSLPAAVLYRSRLENNLQWMQRFADKRKVSLAPHGKTTMAPAVFAHQMAAGSWAMTLATATQVSVAHRFGVRRVIMANQLVGQRNMEIISELLAKGLLDFYCLVDSVDNVRELASFFSARNQSLQVLIEIGVAGGRCGTRTPADVQALVEEIARHPVIQLAGIETYEGVIKGDNLAERIRAHVVMVKGLCLELLAQNAFDVQKIVLTGAGSAWYDIVAEVFGEELNQRIIPVIRPGCYIVHDQGLCMHNQDNLMARCGLDAEVDGDLQSAMEIWAYVQSIPEPGQAVITLGKRDVAFDAGLPIPNLHYRPGSESPVAASGEWRVVSMMDQHAAMTFPAGDDLRVGDIIAFGTSHPCLTFDKWQQMCVIDDNYNVVDLVRTFF